MEAAVTESMWKADERGEAFDGVAMCRGDGTQSLGYGMKMPQRRSSCLGIRCREFLGLKNKSGEAQSLLHACALAF